MKTVTVKLEAEALQWETIPDTADRIKEVLHLLRHKDPVIVAATANAIMQTAANIRLTANLRSMNTIKPASRTHHLSAVFVMFGSVSAAWTFLGGLS